MATDECIGVIEKGFENEVKKALQCNTSIHEPDAPTKKGVTEYSVGDDDWTRSLHEIHKKIVESDLSAEDVEKRFIEHMSEEEYLEALKHINYVYLGEARRLIADLSGDDSFVPEPIKIIRKDIYKGGFQTIDQDLIDSVELAFESFSGDSKYPLNSVDSVVESLTEYIGHESYVESQ